MMRRLFSFLAISLLTIYLVGFETLAKADGSASCEAKTNTLVSGFPSWSEGAHVKVFVTASDFKSDELSAILLPLKNWTAISEASGSHVTFTYAGTTLEPQACLNCLTIMRGRVHTKNKNHAAEMHGMANLEERTIMSARIVIDPIVPNLAALTNAVAHEMGHIFGLNDCLSCGRSTIMGGIRSSDGLDGPTACDVAQIRHVYDELRVRMVALRKKRAQQLAAKAVRVDEGEEPIDDDTPIIAKKP